MAGVSTDQDETLNPPVADWYQPPRIYDTDLPLKRDWPMNEDIVISGISGRFPECESLEEFWQKLLGGVELISSDDRRWPVGHMGLPLNTGKVKDIEKLDNDFFGMNESEVNNMDPQIRILHEVTYEAIVDAGVNPKVLSGSNTGVMIGLCYDDSEVAIKEDESKAPAYRPFAASRLSYNFNLNGPVSVTDTACASSFSAFYQAISAMRVGHCDAAIVAGVAIHLRPSIAAAFHNLQMLSDDGRSKCMDSSADGYCRSEAIVSILLQKKSVARRIYATVLNTRTNNDGFKTEGITFPSMIAQRRLMEETYAEAGVHPHDIKYMEAHMTGTPAGDPVESQAIVESLCVDRKEPLLMGCLKSNMGHTEGASGMCAISKACLVLQKKMIPPNLHLNDPNPNIAGLKTGILLPVVTPTPFDGSLVGVNSFGFGGCNVHSVLKANEKEETVASHDIFAGIPRLVQMCGRTYDAVDHIFKYVVKEEDTVTRELLSLIHEISFMDGTHNTGFKERGFIVLEKDGLKKKVIDTITGGPVYFGFGGNDLTIKGSITLPIYTESLEASNQVIQSLDKTPTPRSISVTKYVAHQIALIDTLTAIQVTPEGIVSLGIIGEILCAYVDGIISKDDALQVAYLYGSGVDITPVSLKNITFHKGTNKWVRGPDVSAFIFGSATSIADVAQFVPKNCVFVDFSVQYTVSALFKIPLGPDVHYIYGPHNVTNIEVLSFIGHLYVAGVDTQINLLYPKVEYPVPRETPAISPLIKWDHSKDWIVPKFPDHYNQLRSNHGFSIDIMETRYQYLTGHCIDGRVLFPATGYLWLVWDRTAAKAGYNSFTDVAVEFRNVKLHRATMLNKNGHTTFKLVHVPETHEFAVVEGGTVCVTGCITLLPPGQECTMMYEDMVKKVDNPDLLTLSTKDIYKEFRVRGYDYGPSFQGLHEASSDGNFARCKWLGNWVSFTDSMLQLAILGSKKRCLILPTFIEYVKCDIKALYAEVQKNKNSLGESEVPVYFDRNINLGVSRGIVVKGLKASPAPRRSNAQVATVETYGFLPYNETTFISHPDVVKIDDYSKYCHMLLKKIVSNDLDPIMHPDFIKLFLESKDKRYTVLRLLEEAFIDDDEDKNAIQKIQERVAKYRNELCSDLIVSLPILNDKLIRPQIDVIIENVTGKKVTVAEATSTNSFIHPLVTELFAASMIQTNYSVLHPNPELAVKVSGGLQCGTLKSTLPVALQPDLIIYKDFSTSFLVDSTPKEVTDFEIQSFLKSAMATLKEGGFILLLNRFCLSSLEEQLFDIQGTPSPKLQDLDHIKGYAEEIGFVIVSEKQDGVSCQSVLLRKPLGKIEASEVVQVDVKIEGFSWVNEIKTHLVDSKSVKRVWLVAEDSPSSGIVGLVNCLRKEQGGDKVRCLFCPPGEGKPGNNLTTDLLKKDLVMNVYRNGAYGSYRHFLLDNVEEVAESEHSYLDMKTKGDLSSLRWVEGDHKFWGELPATMKDPKEILCSIYYSALNFKDVMVATGRIPVDAYPAEFMGNGLIGMEFSGRDQHGNKICSFTGSKAIATTVLLPDPHFIWNVPDSWTLAEAATIPVVYVTVYYAFFIRAHLRPGESLLIHAGSGGIGQAAISVALSMGCRVFTTVGSQAKKEFLLREFPQLDEEDIGNSRDLSFEELILERTNGRGVDLVLNSLADEKLQASIRCLADFGRFIEIGKYDIVQNNSMNLCDMGRNKTYHAVCVAHLDFDAIINKSSAAIGMVYKIQNMVEHGIESGAVRPLKYHIFQKHQTEEAFRFMATGKHTGKVLIQIRDEESDIKMIPKPLAVVSLKQTFFHPLKSYIVTGGLGGFGLELCDWIISRGGKNIIVSSRSGAKTPYQKLSVKRFRDDGAQVIVSNSDVSTFAGAAALIQEAENLAPVGGVFHLAMVLKDAALENQNEQFYDECCAPKVAGTMNLDKITRSSCPQLDYFVCFSSVTSGRGNAGQSNYGFANSFMERVCEVRKKDGLHGLSVQWGAIGDVGVVAESMGGNDIVIGGTLPQRIPSALGVIDQFLQGGHTVYSSIVKATNRSIHAGGKGDLVRTVCHVLGVKDPASLDPNTTLGDLGLDSLMAVEIRQGLERDYEIVLSTQEVRALKIKDIQVIGQKAFKAKSKSEKSGSVVEGDVKFSFELPSQMFIRLNNPETTGRPIFFVPPVEGDFKTILPLANVAERPVIGINWTSELDECESAAEAAAIYVANLRSIYPDDQYDILGYSFGCLIAFEISCQLQKMMGEKAVKKVMMLDGSPDYLKAFTVGLSGRNNCIDEDQVHAKTLLGFTSILHPIDTVQHAALLESLLALPTKEDRTKWVADFITNTAGLSIDSEILTQNAERYFRKMKMIHLYEASDKYVGDVKLVRATETGYSTALSVEIDSDYGLNKICAGNIEVIVMDGDHKSFIGNHVDKIGTILDNHFQYFAFA